jgi:surface protein
MGTMFYNNKSLVILVLTSFDTSKVTNMSSMFVSCNNLTTIYTSDNFVLDNVISDSGMFYDCVSLVGGMGTVYDVNHIDSLYAHYDEGETNPGYFTDKTNAKNFL